MGKRDELPAKVGLSKQARFWGERERYNRASDFDRLWKRVGRFLRRQAGRSWSEVWPELDEVLRRGHEQREIVARVRDRLLQTAERSVICSGGANLRILDGVLIAEMTGLGRTTHAPTYSAAELMRRPDLIEK